MTLIGWLMLGAGVVVLYAGVRNLSVSCLFRSTIQGKASDCTNK